MTIALTKLISVFTAAPKYFGGNTFTMALQPGNNCQQLFFYAANGYMGGTPIDVLVKATGIGQTPLACNQRLKESMPIQCENATQWKTATATKTAVFYVAPNPAKESSTLYYDFMSASSNSTVLVIDMLGRIVANQKLTATSGSTNIDLTQYMQGTYILRLVNNGIVLGQSKLIKN